MLEQHVYVDEALSGAGIDRPGLARLLDATSRAERPFDILLVDDTSRLSRNLADAVRTVEMLCFKGYRIVSVSQGIDSQNEQSDVLMTVHGLVDSLYIKELAKKTHRGLEGRALKGLHTGGRCFGYDNVKDKDSVRYEVNQKESVIVRRIFEMAAEGKSLKTITKTLNGDAVPPPRKRSKKEDASWCHNAIREMLRNELYIGRFIWNRSQFIKQPGTNRRLRRMRPESEWIIVDKPELRIIDDALWHRVRERIAWVNERFNHGNSTRHDEPSDDQPESSNWFLEVRGVRPQSCYRGREGETGTSSIRVPFPRQSRRLFEQREGTSGCRRRPSLHSASERRSAARSNRAGNSRFRERIAVVSGRPRQ
jgi:DNA invertase Pin-like site-specific DNA recombinase